MTKGQGQSKVAVIGGGPSGLVSAKELLLLHQAEVVVFEKSADLGGVWNPTSGCVWNSMHTNISKYSTTYGDFPWPDDVEMFPSVPSVHEYLQAYTDNFGIRERMRFNCEVKSVERILESSSKKKWKVSWRKSSCSSESLESEDFDAVIVATGIFDVPSIPQDIPGLETFPGRILHSRDYRSSSEFPNLSVLTIGGSFSGVEIAADLAKPESPAAKSYHLFCKPFWILRRYLKVPGAASSDSSSSSSSSLPVDFIWHKRSIYFSRSGETSNTDPKDLRIAKNKRLQTFCEDQQELGDLAVSPAEMEDSINVVISDDYTRLAKEKTKLVPLRAPGGIKEIRGSSIILHNDDNEKEIQADAILFATGFKPNIGFLGEEILKTIQYCQDDRIQPVILFHEMLHPQLPGLYFVGLYKGPDFAVMEQQARYAARLIGGKAQLPSKEALEEGLQVEQEIRDRIPRPQFPHPDFVRLADALAGLSGSLPDIEKLLDESYSLEEALNFPTPLPQSLQMRKKEISHQFWNSPVVPAHYNLVDSPKITADHMDLIDQVVKQFLQSSST